MKRQSSGRSRHVCVEEEAALGRHGERIAEQVLEHRHLRLVGLGALRDLRQLIRVAEQDEPLGARCPPRSHRRARPDRLRRRTACAGGARTRRARSSHEVPATSCSPSSSRWRQASLLSIMPVALGKRLSGSPCVDFFRPMKRKPTSCASASTAWSRLWIALWLSEVTPTRCPLRISATAMRAPCQVLPEPGGPWTNRVLCPSDSAASTGSSTSSRTSGRRRSSTSTSAG